jgi:phosphopantetheinyl transferase (holo-ACP synthase)
MAARSVLPFPSALHIGTDICKIERIRRILAGTTSQRFLRTVFAKEELQSQSLQKDVNGNAYGLDSLAQWVAGRCGLPDIPFHVLLL